MKKILLTSILGLMATFGANANSDTAIKNCLFDIANDKTFVETMNSVLASSQNSVRNIVHSDDNAGAQFVDLLENNDFVSRFKTEIAKRLVEDCAQHIIPSIENSLSMQVCVIKEDTNSLISFKEASGCFDNNRGMNEIMSVGVSLWDVFEYVPGAFAFVVTNTDVAPGDKIDPNWSDKTPWNKSCSAIHPQLNIPDDSAINNASRMWGDVLPEDIFTGNVEYFLDAPGADVLAFPGILMAEADWTGKKYIVAYKNLKYALTNINRFVSDVARTGSCSNLNLHLVSLTDITGESTGGFMAPALFGGASTGVAGFVAGAGASGSGLLAGAGLAAGATVVAPAVLVGAVGVGATALVEADLIKKSDRHPATVLKSWKL